jgi:hypothetical protein
VTHGLGAVVVGQGALAGVLKPAVWVGVLVNALLGLAYAYLLLTRRRAA